MPLFEFASVDIEQVRQLARDHWNVELGECVRAAQSHTFLANRNTTERFVLRVMPNPDNKRFDSTELEVALLEYLHENKLPVCRTVQSSVTSSAIVRSGSLILCLFTFATGENISHTDCGLLTSREVAVGLGRWFALLHKLTRRFAQEQPALTARAHHWTTIHSEIVAGVQVDERDRITASDPAYFGLIHGDVNPSNYYWDSAVRMPCMFDWEQLHQSWFLYDLTAPILCSVVLERAGSPISSSVGSQGNSELYTTWLIEGYESGGEGFVVDRAALQRMMMIRRELWRILSRQALLELPADHQIAHMHRFLTDFFDKEAEDTSSQPKVSNSDI